MTYLAADDRYDQMTYRRCGRSGVHLPAVSLGLWHNFGDDRPSTASGRSCAGRSTSASTTSTSPTTTARPTGRPRRTSGASWPPTCAPYRDELLISTKAGYDMWPGPYGEWGSRKYLLSSLDQSLARMGLDYVDIFYSHRFDPDTPLEETMGALDTAVRSGRALYAGISSYSPERTQRGGGDPARPGHPAAHPPAVLLPAQPLDRGRRRGRGACSTSSPTSAPAASPSRRSPRGCSRPSYLGGVPAGLARRRGHLALARLPVGREPRPRPRRSTTSPKVAVRRSPRWRSPGACATPG